MVYIWSI